MESPKKFNYQHYFFISVVLLASALIFLSISCENSAKKLKALQDTVSVKNVQISTLSERIKGIEEEKNKLNVMLENCESDKFIESSKKRQYENELQNIEDECEHEKSVLLLDNRINNSTGNELGELLSRLGQSKSLSDAERLLLPDPTNKGLYKSDIGGLTGEKKTGERREKNKSP